MTLGLSRRGFGRATLAAMTGTGVTSFTILRHARGEEPLKLRCSLDTAPSHVRNVSVSWNLSPGQIEAATDGKIAPEVFHSGSRALRWTSMSRRGAAAGAGGNGGAWRMDTDRHRIRL